VVVAECLRARAGADLDPRDVPTTLSWAADALAALRGDDVLGLGCGPRLPTSRSVTVAELSAD
jgi:hypothetical protein